MPATCSSCPWRHADGQHLYCRMCPPLAEPITGAAVWPRVKPDDFCFAHPQREPAPPTEQPAAQADLPL